MNDEENFNQEMPTRRHFFRFMKCGIGALIGSIIFVKLNQQSYIALGATVFLINAFTIWAHQRLTLLYKIVGTGKIQLSTASLRMRHFTS